MKEITERTKRMRDRVEKERKKDREGSFNRKGDKQEKQ